MYRRNKILVRIVYTPDEYKEFIYNIDTDKMFRSYQCAILFLVFFLSLPLIFFRFDLLDTIGYLIIFAILYLCIIVLVIFSIYEYVNIDIKESKQYNYIISEFKKGAKLLDLLEEVDKDEKRKFVRFLMDVRQRYSL